ncbi:unnamed protein product [Pelagomonas calceolata]|uniref:Uncharacterized protein n=2 Tax=Pelagomonas calceolata TaxID=35677 RepID=A0A8J2SPF2_9STRA|nr:unnamed protein product [Pelagomonas calceolata]
MQPFRAAFVATCAAVAAANNSLELVRDVALEDVPAGPRELHQRYSEIFRYGNRNAASHLWTSYILDRASVTPAAQIESLFSGFCAVSGSPVYPSDYKRYRLRLKHAVTGVDEVGFMYYCCWPCVCDTWDFIKVDTLTITTADGPKEYRFAVIGDPCRNEEQLDVPFIQPFDGRTTTLRRDAPEVRCADSRLIGATHTDHGFIAISMFFDAPSDEEEDRGVWQPGRVVQRGGHVFQDDVEYSDMCSQRAANGYDSGMGEIFRRVAAITPVGSNQIEAPDAIGALL